MTELPINQKEYLKKYLAIGKAPGEKKRKKKKPTSNRVQIIDDDAVTFVSQQNPLDDDVLLVNEDAPQIVAIIDERPPSMRVDEKTKNPLWQPIGTVSDTGHEEQKQLITSFKIEPKSNDKPLLRPDRSPPRRKKRAKDDCSPPRKAKSTRDNNSPFKDIIIKEERRSVSRSEEGSPARRYRSTEEESSPSSRSRASKRDDDVSPQRRSKRGEDISPPRRGRETTRSDDGSPMRRNGGGNSNSSPPRKNKSAKRDDDISPPRRSKGKRNISPPRRGREAARGDDSSPPRRNGRRNSDSSPPRRNREHEKDADISPPRKKYTRNDDISPPRRSKRDQDASPPRRRKDATNRIRSYSKHDSSPPRRSRNVETPPRRQEMKTYGNKTPDSPPIRIKREDGRTEERTADSVSKMKKTLDGKAAGLQNARELVKETQNYHSREENLFKSLSKDVSGENATTVHRDRTTGRIRNLEEEEERQRKKREEEQRNKEKYEKWGRGLAQVESREQQLKDQLHEMSKPLARYADDEDLEKYLKEQEREGDPMLAYIRKKRRKKAAEAGEVFKPQFEGEFMPNRYGIKPGHRWDGVDRSNGYEKKWFEVQNEKKAMQEETYKWSTEDM